MASDALGDVSILIGGDLTPLEQAFEQIPDLAKGVATKIDAAFSGAGSELSGLGQVAGEIANDWHDLGDAAVSAEAGMRALSESMSGAAAGAGETATNTERIPPALEDVKTSAEGADEKLLEFLKTGLELAGITVTLE
ncbi:MAG: hypothetical protein ACREMY_16890, partial [bacterium]